LGIFVSIAVFLASQFLKREPVKVEQTVGAGNKRLSTSAKSLSASYSLKEALGTLQFWTVFLMLFCLSFYTFSILVHYVPHAIQLGVPKYAAAYVLSTISGVSILGNWVMGRAGDRLGPRKIFIVSFALMSAAILWLALSRQLWMLYLFSVVFGFNHGGNATAQAPLCARLFGLKAHGAIFAAASLGFTLGGASGPLVTGYIFDLNRSYSLAWIMCGVVGIVGLALALILRPAKESPARV
jgi:MFS family permease